MRQRANAALRRAIFAAADSPRIQRFVSRHGMRLGARRFVAGETLEDAVRAIRRLNEQGLRANTTLLGEGVATEAEAAEIVQRYEDVIRRLDAEQLQANVALKLTHLGLVSDEELAYANVERLVETARGVGQFIRIDMEESARVDPTLRVFRRLREAGHENVGTVLQAALYRTPADLESLRPLEPNLRLVKGAYLEPPEIAYPRKADVDAAYATLLEQMLGRIGFTAVATHDERLIEKALERAAERGLGRDRFELQMLFGVRSRLQLELAGRGHRVLVATPYGPEWYPYLMRRLAERPANLVFFLRSFVRR